jgi:hypothetical protein
MLEEQTIALLAAAHARRPHAELLQRLLQGSLAAGVNGGVPSLIHSFFRTELPSAVAYHGEAMREAEFLTPARAVEVSPETPTPSSRHSTPRLPMIHHKRGLSENAVPMGAGIPLDTPTSASYPTPSPSAKAPPPSPASVAKSVLITPISTTTLSPSTPAPPLSRSDSLGLVQALWKLYRACVKVFETHQKLEQAEHLERLFESAIQDLRVSIESVENDLEFEEATDEIASP